MKALKILVTIFVIFLAYDTLSYIRNYANLFGTFSFFGDWRKKEDIDDVCPSKHGGLPGMVYYLCVFGVAASIVLRRILLEKRTSISWLSQTPKKGSKLMKINKTEPDGARHYMSCVDIFKQEKRTDEFLKAENSVNMILPVSTKEERVVKPVGDGVVTDLVVEKERGVSHTKSIDVLALLDEDTLRDTTLRYLHEIVNNQDDQHYKIQLKCESCPGLKDITEFATRVQGIEQELLTAKEATKTLAGKVNANEEEIVSLQGQLVSLISTSKMVLPETVSPEVLPKPLENSYVSINQLSALIAETKKKHANASALANKDQTSAAVGEEVPQKDTTGSEILKGMGEGVPKRSELSECLVSGGRGRFHPHPRVRSPGKNGLGMAGPTAQLCTVQAPPVDPFQSPSAQYQQQVCANLNKASRYIRKPLYSPPAGARQPRVVRKK